MTGSTLGLISRATSGTEHPRSNTEVPANMVGIDMGQEIFVDRGIRVVVIDHNEGDVIDTCNLVRRLILFRRTVIGKDDKGHFLPEPDVILEREVEVAGDILDLVEWCFRGCPLEEVVICIEVPAGFPDQGDHCLLDCYCRADPIRIRMVPEDDGLGSEDRLPDQLCDLAHLGPEFLHHFALHEEWTSSGSALASSAFSILSFTASESSPVRIEIASTSIWRLVVAHHHFANDPDDVPQFHFRVGPDAGLDKGGSVLGAGFIDHREDGRAAGLLDLGYFPFNGHGPAHLAGRSEIRTVVDLRSMFWTW